MSIQALIMKLISPLHLFFTLPVCAVFFMMYGADAYSQKPEKLTIKYLDTSVHSRELTELIAVRDSLHDPVFDKALQNALQDNKITVTEMTALRLLADESTQRKQKSAE
ncbi:MAG: hypothetical protein ACRC4K_15365 [Plesiomonas shigelloides]